MKKLLQNLMPACFVCAAACAVGNLSAAPTDGFTQYSSNYYVQNRTDAPLSERFTSSSGTYTTIVYAGEERVEMRWDTWPKQTHENMWEGDIMFDSGTQKTAIMQIKSNSGEEPIYIQVSNPGTVRNDNSSTSLLTSYANKWFHVNASYNPSTGVAKLWINGSLKVTRTVTSSARDWYFKNGCYNNGLPSGGRSKASFKNVKFWVK
jgi:type II secretory pathway pseudopilin PulG